MVVFFGMLAIAVGTALVLFLGLVGLLEAPWPVLLGILLAALYGIQRVTTSSTPVALGEEAAPAGSVDAAPVTSAAPKDTPPEGTTAAAEPAMTYRGVPYLPKEETPATAEGPESAATLTLEGVYRGCHWQKSVPVHPQAPAQSAELTYRGHKIHPPSPDPAPPNQDA